MSGQRQCCGSFDAPRAELEDQTDTDVIERLGKRAECTTIQRDEARRVIEGSSPTMASTLYRNGWNIPMGATRVYPKPSVDVVKKLIKNVQSSS
jgi:hypothetical protein